jgi:predicted nuclease of restriction endonuclease-like RecB superfamily
LLTADLVFARRRGGDLHLQKVDDKTRTRARAIAVDLVETYAAHVGRPREALDGGVALVLADHLEAHASAKKMADGLRKLLDDRCAFESTPGIDPCELRRAVFVEATVARREGRFDRDAILARAATEWSLRSPAEVDTALYADLKGAQRLLAPPPVGPEALVTLWEEGQAQAILLRAVRVRARVRCASAAAYRALFRRLKFLRLLHEIHPVEAPPTPKDPAAESPTKAPRARSRGDDDGYQIVIDGPFSLFEGVTKYGLKLAMVLPALRDCDRFELEADVRWGATRTPLTFRLEGGARPGRRTTRTSDPPAPTTADAGEGPWRSVGDDVAPCDPSTGPEELAALLGAFDALRSDWSVDPKPAILTLPGIGVCVPDVAFEHPSGARVYLELLGFWSREAVFRRVELVEAGLAEKIVFAFSRRLRVREDVLDADLPSALYAYKGTPSARAVLDRLERLRTSSPPRRVG